MTSETESPFILSDGRAIKTPLSYADVIADAERRHEYKLRLRREAQRDRREVRAPVGLAIACGIVILGVAIAVAFTG